MSFDSAGSDAGISALRGCASSDSATFRAAYLRGLVLLIALPSPFLSVNGLPVLQILDLIFSFLSFEFRVSVERGFDIPAEWLSAGSGAIVAALNNEHMVQLPFAALTTASS